jgi:phage gp36-like protein
MAYCNRADLVARFGSREIADLLDRDNDLADDAQALDFVIADTDALIDGYLAGRYAVPVATPLQALTSIACDIVRLKLWDDRSPEEVRKRHDDAIKTLTHYSKGVMVLVGAAGAIAAGSVISPLGGADYSAPERVFTRDTLAGF